MSTDTISKSAIKMTVIFRLEAGCLGPEGKSHIIAFCNFAQKRANKIAPAYIDLKITPRISKDMPEIQYTLNNKGLSTPRVEKYLSLFKDDTDTFEETLNENLILLIEEYFER